MRRFEGELRTKQPNASLDSIRDEYTRGADALANAVEYIVANYSASPKRVMAGALPFLKLFGIAAGGWRLAGAAMVSRSHLAEGEGALGSHARHAATARL